VKWPEDVNGSVGNPLVQDAGVAAIANSDSKEFNVIGNGNISSQRA
jgi:hypothetical protein